MDVAAWLDAIGLGRYAPTFIENDIDAETLLTLTADDLKELGVSSLGHRKKLLAAIAALGTQSDRSIEPDAAAPEGERRPVTVLFCDLTGFTELTRQLGAERTHELTGRFFTLADEAIERFGGRVDKHIGDCVMGVFGAPVAHDNDPERAVRAALGIRAALPALSETSGRPIEAHIGIASGQVVAGGAGGHRSFSITGESVNLAARLTDHAGPCEILISDTVRAALGERLECAEAGLLEIKGLDQPLRAWRALDLRERPGTGRRPLVGRRSELAQFEGMLAACLETGCGLTLHVRGEAGIGKTRLVEEFRRRAESRGFAAHTGLVLDFGAGTGRDAIRALVRSLAGLAADDPETVVRAAALRLVRKGWVSAERAAHLNDLLDLPQPRELRALYDAMDNAGRNRGKRETVAELVARASADQPRFLVIEDLHWADALTLEHLASLAETVARCPALLVMTSRIEGDPIDQAWRARTAGSPLMTLDLGPLRPAEAVALAGAYLETSSAFARRCVERAAGNPLFLEQLLQHAETSAESGVPGSVQSLVQARLDQLRPLDRQALQAASVFGQRFSPDALRDLIERPDYDCDALIAHHLVRPEGADLLFAHALIRDAVYDSLLSARRRELHRRCAAWFGPRDPTLHAEHLDRAEDEAAPRAYLAAARAQAASYRYERARQLIGRGLELARTADDRCALTLLEGDVLHDLGAMSDALGAYQRALDAAPGEAERCRARIGLAAVKRVVEDLPGAFADLDKAEAAAETLGLTEEEARIHYLRGNLFFPQGEIEGCLAEHARALECARAAGSTELEAAALGGLGDAEYVRGRMITAHRRFHEGVELCRAHGLGRIEVANFSMIGHCGLYFRPQSAALADALSAAEAAARVGHLRAELNARLAAFFALFELARHRQMEEQVARAQELVRRLGAWRFEQACLLYLGRVALVEGRRAKAVALLEQALAVAGETSVGFHGPNVLGVLALATEDATARRRLLDEGEALLRAGSVAHNHLRFYPDAMQASLELGAHDRVEQYATALESFTAAEPLPWAELWIALGRALVGRSGANDADRRELERVRDRARELEIRRALGLLDAARGG